MTFISDRQNHTAHFGERRRASERHRQPRAGGVTAYLPLVMREICGLMGGDGAILTLHASNGDPARPLFVDPRLADQTQSGILDQLARGIRTDFEDDRPFWREIGSSSFLVLPVEQLEGHGQLLISVFFEYVSPDQRLEAERLYHERRPMAVGFFQLWQSNRVLEQRAQSLESVLDHTAIGLIMIDRGGRMLFANQTANELLLAGDGIGRSNGMLRAVSLVDSVNLQAALSHAIAGDDTPIERGPIKAPLLAFSRKAGPPLIAAVLPAVSPSIEEGDVSAIVYLVDPQMDTEKMLTPLCRLYGLSPVESILVCHLAVGETIASAAKHMHIKEPTARSYLKTIFIKTATKRQTELVVLMLSSLIRMKRTVLQEAMTISGSARALGLARVYS